MKKGDYVQSRAWYWFGKIVSIPTPLTPLSYIMIIREGRTEPEEAWLPAIITKKELFLYDWEDDHDEIRRRPARKNKAAGD